MTFDSIIGHEPQKNILRRALQNNRVAHAYLFEGPDGIGKRLVALALARALLCDSGRGCGVCPTCRKVDHNNHPDIHLLDAEGAAIKIDQIRTLQQQLSLKPLEGEYKICLIDGAHHLNPAAANALLKTLEEPQPNTLIILLSSQPEALLITIRSRCQRLPFKRLPKQRLTEILADRLDLQETEAAVLAALSEGSFKKALGQNRELYLERRREILRNLMALSSGSIIPLFKLADELAADKDHLVEILEILQAFYRDLLLLKHGRPEQELVNLDMKETLYRQIMHETTPTLLKKLEALNAGRYHLQRNVNRQLAMEIMLMTMTTA
ncbi:DNA polymerase III subunit delta' [Malonomonas rubra]|uniref:DNA polymerase III subunit delta' n=1 Tax=Malonomonas rubra TaxID=57040 RepID=UPI0026EBF84D|nr:DNA polymerase III subunit delta' [Malonomonas rubra]